jgi:hypothetical protein
MNIKLTASYAERTIRRWYCFLRRPRILQNSHRNPLAVVFGSGSKLGSRAAFLNFSVVDASTGSVVKNATITLRRAANLDDFLSTRIITDSRVLISADDPVLVDADGYTPWHYRPSSGANTFNLHADESETVAVKLEHLPQDSKSPPF